MIEDVVAKMTDWGWIYTVSLSLLGAMLLIWLREEHSRTTSAKPARRLAVKVAIGKIGPVLDNVREFSKGIPEVYPGGHHRHDLAYQPWKNEPGKVAKDPLVWDFKGSDKLKLHFTKMANALDRLPKGGAFGPFSDHSVVEDLKLCREEAKRECDRLAKEVGLNP